MKPARPLWIDVQNGKILQRIAVGKLPWGVAVGP